MSVQPRQRILVTGSGNGLGRYLSDRFGAVGMTRANAEAILSGREKYDAIIHCAFSRQKDVDSRASAGYFDDTINLTRRVLELRSGTFIYISSIAVYPDSWRDSQEQDPIPLDAVPTLYGTMKLMGEGLVMRHAQPLVLRLSSLLGPYSPPNVTARVLTGAKVTVPLQAQSLFNYVHYEQVEEMIRLCLSAQRHGIYNVAADEAVVLRDVAALTGADVSYGPILYQAPSVSNAKAAQIVPSLAVSSLEQIKRHINRTTVPSGEAGF